MSKERKEKIVILFLIDFFVTKEGVTGGTERQLIEKLYRLDKDKFEPIVLCLQKSPPYVFWDKLDCENGILHIYSITSFDCIRKIINFSYYLRKRKVDIIESVFFDSIFVGVIAGRLSRVKKVITCRRDLGFWYSKMTLWWFLLFNRLTDRILVNSQATKMFVANREDVSKDKIDVIHNGIDVERIDSENKLDLTKEFRNIGRNDKIVGIVGNCNRKIKRFDVFIKALSEVVKKIRAVKFIVVGDGKLKDELLALSNELGVGGYLVWAGQKENPLPYIKSFHVGVICSDSEGFSNALLEYMASGLGVVATDVGGNGELIQDGKNGFLIPAGDYMALADRIVKLLSDERLAGEMGSESARLVREKYSWGIKIKEYEAYYQRLVGHLK